MCEIHCVMLNNAAFGFKVFPLSVYRIHLQAQAEKKFNAAFWIQSQTKH